MDASPSSEPILPPAGLDHHRLPEDPRIEFLLYRPDTAGEGAPLVVSVHGISRNALEHAELFAPFARAAGAVLLAPIFREEPFGKYQQLASRKPERLRSDDALRRMLDRAHRLTSAAHEKIYLFGHSGGAQFAHRFAMAYPEQVRSAVISAAGWYTLPDPELRYPYGIGERPGVSGLRFDPDRFLKTPFQVLVGPRDVSRDRALRQSEKLDALQGSSRVERGRRWIAAMQEIASARGVADVRLRFDLLGGGRHAFGRAMRRHGLGEAAFAAFGLSAARCPIEP